MTTVIESSESALPPEAKYLAEAAKRRRDDGMNQFEQLHFSQDSRLRGLAADIYADHAALDKLPAPIKNGERIKFAILGAGMGGIVMAIKLINKGFRADQILLVETGGGVGGTWYWNRYPGLHCDVESYVYLPLLEESGYIPKQKYSAGVEIRHHLESLVEKYGLKDRVYFRTQGSGLVWDEAKKVWKVDLTTHRGPEGQEETKLSILADFVILASGIFPYPKVPRVPGLSGFQGPIIHTSRWQYDVTGGSSNEAFPELDKLKDKKVGIIGTGATSIQVVPQLAKYAKELYVFQRTPSQVNSRGQRDTDLTEWREKIATRPGWQRERMDNLAEHMSGHLERGVDDRVNDGWTEIKTFCALTGSRQFGVVSPDKVPEHIGGLMALDAEHAAESRDRVKQIVKDQDTAAKLTSWYPTWCKRPTFSDIYLDAFNQENVHLVDTDGKGVEKFTPTSIVANSQEYPIDVLILSTGYQSFAVAGDPGSNMGIDIVGRNGRHMKEKWGEQGLSTLHGVFSNGFPNLFFQSIPQAGATVNQSHVLVVLSEHIASIIATSSARANAGDGPVAIEASSEAEDAWGLKIAQGAAYFTAYTVCTPSYLTGEGDALKMPDPDDHVAMMKKAKASPWYGGLVDYAHIIEEWRSDGKLGGVEISVGG
ncbi:hypothetical protein ACN47E_010198 [Coniothyrium glycines]